MAQMRAQAIDPHTPVKTLGAAPHPGGAMPRKPKVVALRQRPGRHNDERTRHAAAPHALRHEAPVNGATARPGARPDARPGARLDARPGARLDAQGRDGAVPRAAEVVPFAPRGESQRRWHGPRETADDGSRLDSPDPRLDEALDDLEGVDDAETGADTDDSEAATGHLAPPAGSGRAAPPALAQAADDATLAEWITRIAQQDERALEALYDATSARVSGVVLRIVQRAALAEEVLEDTFWQVWRQAPRFDAARGRPVTWLLAMARSRAIDALRREQRHQHDELPDDDAPHALDTHEAGSGAALPPKDLLEAARGHDHVHAALASLEARSRQLVALAFFRGLTHEEIAEQQGLPLGTVKSLIRRALQQLQRVMEAEHA